MATMGRSLHSVLKISLRGSVIIRTTAQLRSYMTSSRCTIAKSSICNPSAFQSFTKNRFHDGECQTTKIGRLSAGVETLNERYDNQHHHHDEHQYDERYERQEQSPWLWSSVAALGIFVGVGVLNALDTPLEAAGFFGKKTNASANDGAKILLYWASGSPPCWRVMLALEEKGIRDYDSKLLNMDNKENKGPDVLKLNPKGQVPTFTHNGNIVNESLAIVDYLEATFKKQGTKLLPDDASNLALVLQRKYEAAELFTIGIREHFFYSFKKPEEKTQSEVDSRLKAFRDQLAMWDSYFKQMGPNSYAAGQEFSMADVVLFPTIALMWRLGLRLEQYPNIKAYFERTRQRESVIKTWPPHWKKGPNQSYLEEV